MSISHLGSTTVPAPFTDIVLDLPDRRVGKVRVSYELPDDERLFVTTDRLSAFDRVIAGVPHKGQVLNQLSGWWFERQERPGNQAERTFRTDHQADQIVSVTFEPVNLAVRIDKLEFAHVIAGHAAFEAHRAARVLG